jgi:predicted DsbA family dithiol-disulfide isomerase
MAKMAGLDYNYDIIKNANTFKAHRLFQYAKTLGLGNAISERLLAAHFLEGIHINNDEELLKIAGAVGLDLEKTKEVLTTDLYSDEVQKDVYSSRLANVRGVPHFLINGEIAVSGAQPVAEFVKILDSLNAEMLTGMTCGPDGC